MSTINPQLLSKQVQVLDKDNQPIPYVNIIWGDGQGTITNDQGQATVRAATPEQVIEFTFIGMRPVTTKFKNITGTIQMAERTEELDPVLVVGEKKGTPWLTIISVGISAIGLLYTINDSKDLIEGEKLRKKLKKETKTLTI